METLSNITPVQWYGIILALVGLLLRYIVGRNRFDRRGVGGLQHYDSYFTAFATSAFERLLKTVGTLLLLSGIFLIAVECYNRYTVGKTRQERLLEQRK